MSGLAAVFQRDGGCLGEQAVRPVMRELAHRGIDGNRVVAEGPVALGHHHFRTTPEEVGERQPTTVAGGRVRVIFDGRLDNRPELLAALGLDTRELSDAALVGEAYSRWGEGCVARFEGPFAVVVYDASRERLVCARDALGERRLFYFLSGQTFVAASEARAVLAYPGVPDDEDETSKARFCAVMAPEPGATYYRGVRQLEPAGLLVVERDRVCRRTYWSPEPGATVRYRDDRQYAERFRELLDRSVRSCLRGAGAPAVLMSGGLDSTAVAALAARTSPVRAVSWVFDKLHECDERKDIDRVVRKAGLTADQFTADGLWPLSAGPGAGWNGDGPVRNPFWELLDEGYRVARRGGGRVVLNGWFGDELYNGAGRWLADLTAERRLVEAARGVWAHARTAGWRRCVHPVRLAMGIAPGRRMQAVPAPPWMAPETAAMLQREGGGGRAAAVLEGRPVAFLDHELAHAHLAGVELRMPFWSRKLVEFMLAIPAHQLYRRGRYKHVQRSAMGGILPEEIFRPRRKVLLTPLYRYGVLQREREWISRVLSLPDARWRRFVREDWMRGVVERLSYIQDQESVVFWQCVALELWPRLGSKGRAGYAVSMTEGSHGRFEDHGRRGRLEPGGGDGPGAKAALHAADARGLRRSA